MDIELERVKKENLRLRGLLEERTDLRIADMVPALICHLDKNLRYTYVNKAYEKWFDVRAEDLIGIHIKDLVGDEVYEQGLPFFQKVLKGETVDREEWAPYKKGARHIHINFLPDKDHITGEVIGIIAFVQDISDRKNLERVQAELNNKREEEFRIFTSLFEEAPVGMAFLEGPDLRFAFANRYYRNYFLPELNYLNRPLRDAIPAVITRGTIKQFEQVLETGRPFEGKEYFTSISQEEFYFNYILQAVKDENQNVIGILIVFNEVSEQVLSKKELIEERDIRERFVSTLTHDLRTPLTAAHLSAQIILKKSADPQSVKTLATRILGSLNRVEDMVTDLLDANRINAGEGIPISTKLSDLNLIIDESMLDLLAVHGNRFSIVKKTRNIQGKWDETAIKRILDNLANNAVKYGDPNSTVTISSFVKDDNAYLSVHNRGNAIPPSDQDKLFNSFKRLSSAETSGKAGWGIGLSLVRGLTIAHGGSISVESTEAAGTTFTVRLPIKK